MPRSSSANTTRDPYPSEGSHSTLRAATKEIGHTSFGILLACLSAFLEGLDMNFPCSDHPPPTKKIQMRSCTIPLLPVCATGTIHSHELETFLSSHIASDPRSAHAVRLRAHWRRIPPPRPWRRDRARPRPRRGRPRPARAAAFPGSRRASGRIPCRSAGG